MKKYLRILYIFPASFLITGLVWVYRYIWFSIETIPFGRGFTLLMAIIISSIIIVAVENIKD